MRYISDHKSWAGNKKGSFDTGFKSTDVKAGYGECDVKDYPDTAPMITKNQNSDAKRIASRKVKDARRN